MGEPTRRGRIALAADNLNQHADWIVDEMDISDRAVFQEEMEGEATVLCGAVFRLRVTGCSDAWTRATLWNACRGRGGARRFGLR